LFIKDNNDPGGKNSDEIIKQAKIYAFPGLVTFGIVISMGGFIITPT